MSTTVLLKFDTSPGENPPPSEEVFGFFTDNNTSEVWKIYPSLEVLIEELDSCNVDYRGQVLEHNDEEYGLWHEVEIVVENDITHTLHTRNKFIQEGTQA